MLGILVFGGLVPAGAQSSQDALSTLAKTISEKRGRVETLSSELDLLKADYNETLRSLASQRADLETQIKREELRLAQLGRDLEEVQIRTKSRNADLSILLPVAEKSLEVLEDRMKTGIPFQVDQRLSEIRTLRELMEEGRLDAGSLLARVWNEIESEYRLTAESGLYRQRIVLGGQEQMVEVIRLGMVLMYFRTFDERFGMAVRGASGWEYKLLDSRDDQKLVSELYEALRKNLKEGYFLLPNPGLTGGRS